MTNQKRELTRVACLPSLDKVFFFLLVVGLCEFASFAVATQALAQQPVVNSVDITVTQLFQPSGSVGIGTDARTSGIGPDDSGGVSRRDPSDVIKLENNFYVFYTKTVRQHVPPEGAWVFNGNFTSGYSYGEIWYATSIDGTQWVERGQALGRGQSGVWDSASVFTPNVVKGTDDEVYLYYTGIDEDGGDYNGNDVWNSDSFNDITQIGVARLDLDSNGLVTGATRLNSGNPILSPTYEPLTAQADRKFDSYRVDDSSLVIFDFDSDGDLDYGLYYKGRKLGEGAGTTKMGLAIADNVDSQYVRQNNGDSVQATGHEVMVWNQGEGVMSLVSASGNGLFYAEDKVIFQPVRDESGNTLDTRGLSAPGAFRQELTDYGYTGGISWGIRMDGSNGGSTSTSGRFLSRYDISFDIFVRGDLNGDGLVDNFDIAPFALALFDRAAYDMMYTEIDSNQVGDFSGDGVMNNFDIVGFAAVLGF